MSEFDGFARYYDADYGAFDEDVPFFRELARRADGPVLELMCGSGRLLLPLARAGFRITGVDISPELLAIASRKVAASKLTARVTLVEGDVRAELPAGPFSLAIVGLNSFMHLADSVDQLATLGHIHAALQPNGLLALDLFNPDPREMVRHNGEVALDKMFTLNDGTRVQKFVIQSIDPAAQTNQVVFMYDELSPSGQVRRVTLPFTMRWIYRYELEHLLARAGFAVEAVYGSYELDSYNSASEVMLTVARKV